MNQKQVGALPIIVDVPSIKVPIQRSPGFCKKQLSDFKLDILGLCQFGCAYCSSNEGYYLRTNRKKFTSLTVAQTGQHLTPSANPRLTFRWNDVVENLTAQLAHKPSEWGAGQTLVFSMLTDGFSPMLVSEGVTETCLQLVLNCTQFRIRVLTKNAIVGTTKWIRFFQKFRDRVVVGLSVGTLDNVWAQRVEKFTPQPKARVKALQKLQDAGVPTYGMLCPVFPEVLRGDGLERLVDAIRPDMVEDLWAEPFNDRTCWKGVRDCFPSDSPSAKWLTRVFEEKNRALWSTYATELYARLLKKAKAERWTSKLNYLLYEGDITPSDAEAFHGLEGVLLQCKPDENGKSKNPAFAVMKS